VDVLQALALIMKEDDGEGELFECQVEKASFFYSQAFVFEVFGL